MYFRKGLTLAKTVHNPADRGGIVKRYGSLHDPLERFLDGKEE